jgi:dihydrofolate reductase
MSKRVRYQVATTLDGFIAGPNGEYDWIVQDPAVDFNALYKQFDTVIMGRKTFEPVMKTGQSGAMPGLDVIIFSRTLPPRTAKGVRITNDDPREVVAALKKRTGRDIWLFGGGVLFRTLLDAGLVDTVEVAVMPVMLGEGIPLLPPGAAAKLVLSDRKVLPSGIVVLAYRVASSRAAAPRIAYIKTPRKRAGAARTPRRSVSGKRRK